MWDFLLRPIKCNFGRDKVYYRMIDRLFGFVPNNIELYKLALIHKSASVDIGERQSVNNERLEFLGDAVIENVTSDYVYIEYPGYEEGRLTQLRSKIVSRQSLNEIARKIGLDRCVHYNRTGNFSQKNIFGDAFEAMMGAIYLDQGYDFVNRLLINRIYANHLSLEEADEVENDFKSRLIEWGQKHHHRVHFRTRGASNGTSAHFSSIVMIDNIEAGHGFGESKKEAEQDAARSVAHSVSDDDCTRLLDKLDRIEMRGVTAAAAEGEGTHNDAEASGEEKPRRRRSRRGGRRRRSGANAAANAMTEQGAEVAAAEVAAAEPVAEEPIAAPVTEPAAEVAEKPARRRSSRKSKAEQSADNAPAEVVEAVTEPVAEPAAEPAAEEEKPARKPRRTRKPKAEQGAEAPVAEVVAEPAAEPASEPVKKRRTRKPKAEQGGEAAPAEVAEAVTAPVAEVVADEEKPARKPRRTRKPKAEQGEESAPEQSAE